MTRKPIKTKIEDIVDYWSRHMDECGLSVDWSEAHSHCWRCGYDEKLERCHIIPHALGGQDAPDNLVLLCKRCHAENPNVADKEVMWDWIRACGVPFYETFWWLHGLKEYKFIYRKSLAEELNTVGIELEKFKKEFNKTLDKTTKQASRHFAQNYLNSTTMAGLVRMTLKRLAKEKGVVLPKQTPQPWWMSDI